MRFDRKRMQCAACLSLLCVLPTFAQSRTVAITVDDLPCANCVPVLPDGHPVPGGIGGIEAANRKLLAGFLRAHVPVTGFVVQQGVEEAGTQGPAILKEWIQDGLDLGNHTYSHPEFNSLTTEGEEKEIIRGEAQIKPLMERAGRKLQFFRFPYNQTGDTGAKHDAVAAFLKARGYQVAACTIDTSDYVFNAAYVQIVGKKDLVLAARLREEYLAYTAAEIDYYAALDKQVLGYEPPEVMLLHDSLLNADTVDDILGLFPTRGYRFVSLAEAERDPVYRAPATYVTKFGLMWGYRWARERGVKVNGRLEPEPPAWILQYGKPDALSPPSAAPPQ